MIQPPSIFLGGRIAHINISPKFVGRYILLYILDFCRAIKITIVVPNNKHENILIPSSWVVIIIKKKTTTNDVYKM